MSYVDLIFPAPDLQPGYDATPGEAAPNLLRRAFPVVAHLLTGVEAQDTLTVGLLDSLLQPAGRLGEICWGSTVGPWHLLLDPELAPAWALPYAAQTTLARLPGRRIGESEEDWTDRARDAVLHPPLRKAGSVGAIRAAARPFLSGTKAVRVVHQVGDEWHIDVRVRSDEVIDQPALAAAIDDPEILTAGVKPTLVLVAPGTPWTIAEVEDVYADRTIAHLEANFATIAALEANPGGI